MKFFAKKLGIAAHQIPRATFIWNLRFLFQIGFVLSWTITTALFVDIFGIENILLLLLIDAGLFLVGSILSNYLFINSAQNTFILTTILGTILMIIFSFVYRSNPVLCLTLILLAKDFFFSQLGIALLRKNESLFSPSEAQKIMPILESSGTIGTIFASISFLLLLKFYELDTIIISWIIPLILMAAMIIRSPKILSEVPTLITPKKVSKKSVVQQFMTTQNIPFIKMMTVIVFIQATLFSVIEFEFLKSVNETTHAPVSIETTNLQANLFSESIQTVGKVGHEIAKEVKVISGKMMTQENLAHNLGVFGLLFGVLALMVQLFLTHKVLKKIGIANTIMVYFSGLLSMIGLLFVGGVSMSGVKSFQHGFHSLFEAPYHLSFYSIGEHKRESVRHFFEGFIKPLGIIFGVTMLISLQNFTHTFTIYLMAFLIACLLVLTFFMKKHFTKLSHENLKSDENIGSKVHAIEVLTQKGHEDAAQMLGKELQKSDIHPVIQEKIIKSISKINDPKAVHIYLELLMASSTKVEMKIQILESLLRLDKLNDYWACHSFSQHHLLRVLQKIFAETDHPYLQKLVIMNIFKHLPTHKVAPYFLEILSNKNTDIKAICLRSAAEVFDDPEVVYYVQKYLKESSPKLRGYAIIALWKFKDKTQLHNLIASLISGSREEQIAGIYAAGEVHDKMLSDRLYAFLQHHDIELRLHALVALMKLEDEYAIKGAMKILFGEDAALSQKLFFMLRRVPKSMRELIKSEITYEVSHRVLKILIDQKVRKPHHLKSLSHTTRQYLKRLYRLGEKYDDLVLLS